MNRVVLVGRLARDPNELRRSVSGTSAISFTIAVDSRSKQEGHEAEFISCVAFNKTAEFVDAYFRKGLQVGIDGRLQTRDYEKNGARVYVTEVVCENVQILEPKKQEGISEPVKAAPAYEIPSSQPVQQEQTNTVGFEISDDDLAF